MKHSFNLITRTLGVGVLCAAGMGVAHADPTCGIVGTSGSVAFKVAVASNFYLPALNLANSYLNGKSYKIKVCHDSSGNLFNAIGSTNVPQYALFFSADTDKPSRIPSDLVVEGPPAVYAKGVPAFLLSPDAYDAVASSTSGNKALAYLDTSTAAPGATIVNPDTSALNYVSLKMPPESPAVATLAIGDPSLAPYGLAAAGIIGRPPPAYANNMGQWPASGFAGAGSNVGVDCSTLLGSGQWMCAYSNIDNTLTAIYNDSVTAGFVAYSQICPTMPPPPASVPPSALPVSPPLPELDQYVLFPDYETTQAYVQLVVNDATAQAKATSFRNYLFGVGSTPGALPPMLPTFCYNAP